MMMKPLHHHHQSQHRGGGTARTRPPPTTTTTLPPPRTGTMSNPFNYIVDDDLLSMESSKICQPRSTEAFKTAGLAGMADNGSGGGCGPCQCIAFLDPFPNQLTSWRSSPNLTHYCRVCNTQLNSCKQSSIHAEGKKHAKRLAYLKFCVETSAQNEKDMIAPVANIMPLTSSPPTMLRPPNGVVQQQQLQQQHQLPVQAPPPQQTMMSSLPPPQQLQQPPPIQAPTFAHPSLTLMPQYMSYATPVSTASTTYYYPTCYQSYAQPMPQQQQQQQQPTASYQVPMYQEFVSPPPVPNVPPPTMSTMVAPPPTIQTMAHYIPANQGMPQQQQQQQRNNDVTYPMFTLPQSQEMMNPLLSMQYSCYESPRKVISSSGYGSSSTTSTASPPSTSGNKGETGSNSISSNNSINNKSSAESRKRFYCDLCQMAFPSQSVLENHVSGSRHIRRLKTQQPYRQLKDEMHQQHQQQQQQQHQQQQEPQSQERGVHRCEVCQVTVNSSHQLQAHLEGHKHRVRCFRRGLQPETTVLTTSATTPNSSTPPSTAPSECSSSLPTLSSSPNNNNNSSSNNNQQQQTVAIAAKTTAHSSNVRGLNNNNNTNINSNSKMNNETGNKAACSLLGRPRPLQPNGMPGAGLMGASPHLATSAIISPAAFIRRNGNGGGLLPLPLQPGKMTGLLVAGSSTTAGVNFSSSTRVTRSNLGSKSKGRKPNRPARCLLPQDHHDSTTESDEPASADGCKKKDVKEAVSAAVANNNGNNIINKLDDSSTIESSLSSSLSSSASASCSASTSGGDNSSSKMEINHDSSSSDEAKESEASSDSSETQKDVVINGKSSQTSKVVSTGKTSFSCDTCDVRMNSAAQLAQHLKSPKHHMKASTVDGAQSDPDKKVKSVVTESPLLNMFLKTLVTSPQAFFSTPSDKEGEEGSNTEVER